MAAGTKPIPLLNNAPVDAKQACSSALVPGEPAIMGDGQLGGDLLATPTEINPEGSEQLANNRLLDRVLNG